jgi:hypothetical protein
MQLEDYEKYIKVYARRYGESYRLIDDFEQIGRMTAWRLLSKESEPNRPYVLTSIKNSMLRELMTLNTKKRRPNNGRVVSLDSLVMGEDWKSDQYTPRSYDSNLIIEEKMQDIYEGLKNICSGKYITGLKKLRNPKDKAKSLIKNVIEDIYGYSPKELTEKVDSVFFKSNPFLKSLLSGFFNNSYINALSHIYGEDFVKYDLLQKPNKFWRGKKGHKRAIDAVAWFVTKNKIIDPRECRKFGYKEFQKDKLSGMLQICFNGSPYLALKTYFPTLRPWESRRVPKNYFDNEENQKNAIRFFLIERGFPPIDTVDSEEFYSLKLGRDISIEDMRRNGLSSILKRHGSLYRTFTDLFPEQILPWTFSSKETWKKDPEKTATSAIKWVFDDYLKISKKEIPKYATTSLFWRIGFSGIMTNRRIGFNSCPYNAINAAYPGVYSRSDFLRKNSRN